MMGSAICAAAAPANAAVKPRVAVCARSGRVKLGRTNRLGQSCRSSGRRLIQRHCEAPGDSEREWEISREEDQSEGQLYQDIQPVFVEEIQQKQQQDTMTDRLSSSSLSTAMTADGNVDMSYPFLGQSLIQMDSETTKNFFAVFSVLGIFMYEFFSLDLPFARGWYADEFLRRTLMDNWARYEFALHQHPIFVKACTSSIIYFISDWLAQSIQNKSPFKFDRANVVRNAAIGFLIHGPMSHFWYIFSDEHIPFVPTWYGWLPKMVADQTVYAFTWNVLYMFLIGATKGEDMEEVFDRIKSMWWPLQREGWKLWPLIHIVTYNFIPREERVLWVDMVELIWVVMFITILKKEDNTEIAADSNAAAAPSPHPPASTSAANE